MGVFRGVYNNFSYRLSTVPGRASSERTLRTDLPLLSPLFGWTIISLVRWPRHSTFEYVYAISPDTPSFISFSSIPSLYFYGLLLPPSPHDVHPPRLIPIPSRRGLPCPSGSAVSSPSYSCVTCFSVQDDKYPSMTDDDDSPSKWRFWMVVRNTVAALPKVRGIYVHI